MSKAQGQTCVISVAFRCETRVIAGVFQGKNCGVTGANSNVSKCQGEYNYFATDIGRDRIVWVGTPTMNLKWGTCLDHFC